MAVNRSVKLSRKNWEQLERRLKEEHPLSVFAIRDKMKRVLGFTVRKDWGLNPINLRHETIIHLDFFDDSKKTMFLLKYGDYVPSHLNYRDTSKPKVLQKS